MADVVVVSATAVERKKVRVLFDQDVKQVSATLADDSLNPANYTFLRQNQPVNTAQFLPVASSVVAIDTDLVEITVDDELSFGLDYRVEVRNVESVGADPMDALAFFADFTAFQPLVPATREFNYIDFFPKVLVGLDSTGDLQKWASIIQDCLDSFLAEMDLFTETMDIDKAPSKFLDMLLYDLGNPFNFDLSDLDKRRLARLLVSIYKQKGTEPGVQNMVRFFLGIELVDIVEHLEDCWSLGEAELGFDTILCAGSGFDRFSFDIIVDRTLTQFEKDSIRTIVDYMKPAHTHFVNLIEPASPLFVNHWELGLSDLGVTTVLHA